MIVVIPISQCCHHDETLNSVISDLLKENQQKHYTFAEIIPAKNEAYKYVLRFLKEEVIILYFTPVHIPGKLV